jgi:hypothetical protein
MRFFIYGKPSKKKNIVINKYSFTTAHNNGFMLIRDNYINGAAWQPRINFGLGFI